MIRRIDRIATELPPPSEPDVAGAAAVQELMGGRFGEMSTFMNYMFQSFNFRNRQGARPFYDLVANIAAEAEARRRGADDAVFADAGGVLLEGPVTNIWWRVGGTLYTPALELGILAGVTRAVVLEEAADADFAVAEGTYRLPALAAADEAFTSSSVREILPVVSVDGNPVGDGRPGTAALALQAALRRVATQL